MSPPAKKLSPEHVAFVAYLRTLGCSQDEIEQVMLEFSGRNPSCDWCGGFYEEQTDPNRPLCATCHALRSVIYAFGPYEPACVANGEGYSAKKLSDDGENDSEADSGNEEGEGMMDASLPNQEPGALGNGASGVSANNSDGDGGEPAVNNGEHPEQGVDDSSSSAEHPTAPPVGTLADNLREDEIASRINALSSYKATGNSGRRGAKMAEHWLETTFPDDMLLVVFDYLDPISQWCCSRVCSRWRKLIRANTKVSDWSDMLKYYWPLFSPLVPLCPFKAFARLIQATTCRVCLQRHVEASYERLVSQPGFYQHEHKRQKTEAARWKFFGRDAIAVPQGKNYRDWCGYVAGPVGTPYEGGKFFLIVKIPPQYPFRPLCIQFMTKIFHPNVNMHGDIGVDMLHPITRNWIASMTVQNVLIGIQSLLSDPNAHLPMNSNAAKLYCDNRPLFDAIAQMWTHKFAMVEFAAVL